MTDFRGPSDSHIDNEEDVILNDAASQETLMVKSGCLADIRSQAQEPKVFPGAELRLLMLPRTDINMCPQKDKLIYSLRTELGRLNKASHRLYDFISTTNVHCASEYTIPELFKIVVNSGHPRKKETTEF